MVLYLYLWWMRYWIRILAFAFVLLSSCSKDDDQLQGPKQLTIFYVNDVHGQLDNFVKVKQIIDRERQETNVIVDLNGKLLIRKTSKDRKLNIDTSELKSGLYVLKISTGQNSKSQLITKIQKTN